MFLGNMAQGQGPELPAIAKLAVRGLLPRILADVDDADPEQLDATMLEVARGALGIRSDGGDELVIAVKKPSGDLVELEPASVSDGEPRTEEDRDQAPGESGFGDGFRSAGSIEQSFG